MGERIAQADRVIGLRHALLSWTAATFEGCLRQFPAISRNAIVIVAKDANKAFERVREFAREQVEQRMAHTIQRVATVFFSDTDNPANYWLPLSRRLRAFARQLVRRHHIAIALVAAIPAERLELTGAEIDDRIERPLYAIDKLLADRARAAPTDAPLL